MLGRRLVNARNNQLVPVAFDDDVPVVQCVPADAVDVVEPALRLAEVFVVPGDVHTGESRPHCAERSGLCLTDVDRSVGDVADVAHDVGAERVHPRPRRPTTARD
jgi:hypothetical protein